MRKIVEPYDEFTDLSAAIARLELAAFLAKRDLTDFASERERLLDNDTVTIDQFSALNRRRDTAELAIAVAARSVPRLQSRLAFLVDERRKSVAEEYRERLRAAVSRIEKAVLAVIASNADAEEIMHAAGRDLGENFSHRFGLINVQFIGRATLDGLEDWRRFIAREFTRKQSDPPPIIPPRATAAAMVVPSPDEHGRLKIFFLKRHRTFQPGDTIALPAKEAEGLVQSGACEFLESPAAAPCK